MFGWTGKILEIDIDRRPSTILSRSTEYSHKHLGGRAAHLGEMRRARPRVGRLRAEAGQ